MKKKLLFASLFLGLAATLLIGAKVTSLTYVSGSPATNDVYYIVTDIDGTPTSQKISQWTMLYDAHLGGYTTNENIDLKGSLLFPDNVRQTANPGATHAGFNVGWHAGDPTFLINGDVWYDTISQTFNFYQNGSVTELGGGGGGGGLTTNSSQFAGAPLSIKTNASMTNAVFYGNTIHPNQTASRVALFNGNSELAASSLISLTEINYLDGVTANVQTSLDGKQPLDAGLTALSSTSAGIVVATGSDTFNYRSFNANQFALGSVGLNYYVKSGALLTNVTHYQNLLVDADIVPVTTLGSDLGSLTKFFDNAFVSGLTVTGIIQRGQMYYGPASPNKLSYFASGLILDDLAPSSISDSTNLLWSGGLFVHKVTSTNGVDIVGDGSTSGSLSLAENDGTSSYTLKAAGSLAANQTVTFYDDGVGANVYIATNRYITEAAIYADSPSNLTNYTANFTYGERHMSLTNDFHISAISNGASGYDQPLYHTISFLNVDGTTHTLSLADDIKRSGTNYVNVLNGQTAIIALKSHGNDITNTFGSIQIFDNP